MKKDEALEAAVRDAQRAARQARDLASPAGRRSRLSQGCAMLGNAVELDGCER
jgi:hypothetical protein